MHVARSPRAAPTIRLSWQRWRGYQPGRLPSITRPLQVSISPPSGDDISPVIQRALTTRCRSITVGCPRTRAATGGDQRLDAAERRQLRVWRGLCVLARRLHVPRTRGWPAGATKAFTVHVTPASSTLLGSPNAGRQRGLDRYQRSALREQRLGHRSQSVSIITRPILRCSLISAPSGDQIAGDPAGFDYAVSVHNGALS